VLEYCRVALKNCKKSKATVEGGENRSVADEFESALIVIQRSLEGGEEAQSVDIEDMLQSSQQPVEKPSKVSTKRTKVPNSTTKKKKSKRPKRVEQSDDEGGSVDEETENVVVEKRTTKAVVKTTKKMNERPARRAAPLKSTNVFADDEEFDSD
jgi:hypothetical protein